MAIREIGWLLVAPVLAGIFSFNRCYADSGLVNVGAESDSYQKVFMKREEPGEWKVKYPVFKIDRGESIESPFVHTQKKTERVESLSKLPYPNHLIYLHLIGLASKESLEKMEGAERELLANVIANPQGDELNESYSSSGLLCGLYKERYGLNRIGDRPDVKDLSALADFIVTEGVFGDSAIARVLGNASDMISSLARLKLSIDLYRAPWKRTYRERKSHDNYDSWRIIGHPHLNIGWKGVELDLLRAANKSSELRIGFDVKP